MLEIRDASGEIEGIEVTLTAHILDYRPNPEATPKDDPNRKARMDMLKRCLDEARNWKFDEKERPRVNIAFDGDFADRSTLHEVVNIAASNVEKGGHVLQKVTADAEWNGTLLTLNSLKASDRRGELDARADFDLNGREGRFGLSSGLDLPRLLRSWFGVESIRDVTFAGEQKVEANGSFQLVDNDAPIVKLTGLVACKSLMVRGVPFDTFETAFSWSRGNLFLRGLKAARRDGQISGKILLQDSYVRAAIDSDLPLAVARPFFVGQPFGRVLGDFVENDHTKVRAKLECGWDLNDVHAWVVTGHGKVEQCTYRGTPFISAETDLDLSHSTLNFQHGAIVFDYRGYPMQRAHDGAKTGSSQGQTGPLRLRCGHRFALRCGGEFLAGPADPDVRPRGGGKSGTISLPPAARAPGIRSGRYHRPEPHRPENRLQIVRPGRLRVHRQEPVAGNSRRVRADPE